MLTPVVRKTYAPRGQTPILKAYNRHDRITAISAVTLSPIHRHPNLYFTLLADNANATGRDIVRFLEQLKSALRGPMTILWDGGYIHDKCAEVREWLAKNPQVVTEKLPPYAPELNPDEGVWKGFKYDDMANFSPKHTREMRQRIADCAKRVRRRPALLTSYYRHAGLGSLLV
jgi:transposase